MRRWIAEVAQDRRPETTAAVRIRHHAAQLLMFELLSPRNFVWINPD